jgi:ParB/RepB/Spo0J family partition protein
LARPDFRAVAARRLSEERELSPAIVSLLSPEVGRHMAIRQIALDQIEPNPDQPRLAFDETTLGELAASIREHGVLQPVLVRPLGPHRFQLIAGERRWRASRLAQIATIPAMVDEIDDETAMEIAIIENLQREDLSPLDEAAMYDRMIRDHGYSIRRLADKLGKDKGYVENRLRLADAPPEIRQLVSVRKDTLSHAYELLKVADPKRRRRLADQVARGELSLVKLRDRIEARPRGAHLPDDGEDDDLVAAPDVAASVPAAAAAPVEDMDYAGHALGGPIRDDSLVMAKQHLADALEGLVEVLSAPDVIGSIPEVDRTNLAKYLTIAKLRLENAIALVRRS